MKYDIRSHRRGDTWKGISEIEIIKNDDPMDLTDALIRMQVKKKAEDEEFVGQWTTVDGSIVITDGENGKFRIMGRIVDFPPENYVYDVEIQKPNEKVITIMEGNWTIIQDVTR